MTATTAALGLATSIAGALGLGAFYSLAAIANGMAERGGDIFVGLMYLVLCALAILVGVVAFGLAFLGFGLGLGGAALAMGASLSRRWAELVCAPPRSRRWAELVCSALAVATGGATAAWLWFAGREAIRPLS